MKLLLHTDHRIDSICGSQESTGSLAALRAVGRLFARDGGIRLLPPFGRTRTKIPRDSIAISQDEHDFGVFVLYRITVDMTGTAMVVFVPLRWTEVEPGKPVSKVYSPAA